MIISLRKFLNVAAGLASLLLAAQLGAVPINITNAGGVLVNDLSRGDIPNNSPATHLTWLTGQVTGYNTITSSSLPAPAGVFDASAGIGGPISLVGFTYATLHYGTGPGGTGQGGGIVALYLNGTTSFTFPQNGGGPNGNGGLSTIYLMGPAPRVPEDGSVAALLAFALVGVILFARRVRR